MNRDIKLSEVLISSYGHMILSLVLKAANFSRQTNHKDSACHAESSPVCYLEGSIHQAQSSLVCYLEDSACHAESSPVCYLEDSACTAQSSSVCFLVNVM